MSDTEPLGTVVVTGGARGIGRAIAVAILHAGGRVLLVDRDAPSTEAALAELACEGRVAGCAADITAADAWGRILADAEALGPVSGLVLAAGIVRRSPFLEVTRQQWDEIMDVHLGAAFEGLQATARLLVEHGRSGSLVYIASSAAAGLGPPQQAHYVAAKAGALGLVRAASRELGPFGIRVNAVSPGFTNTELNTGLFSEEELALRRAQSSLGRVAEPEDVAGAVLFLLGAGSAFVTGQTVHVNGGSHMP